MSCLPLGLNQIEIQRGLTTSSTAIFVPFTTQELFQNGKEALYYGINALSNNLIMVDRKLLKNPNGLILGTPGSGKSFSAKREIANCFLLTSDDVIICDPEAEYAPLVERLHGQVIKISPTSTNYINPMDLNLDYSDDESPLSLKSDFILSLCELIVGGKEGLQPVQKTIIDRCVRLVYQTYLNDPRPENMPILENLYNLLRSQEEKEAQYIATALEIYVTGSLNVFNHQSNVDINNRIVCYDIKELGKQLKKIGMLVVQDQVWNRVTINRAAHKSTRYYIDEMHLLLKEEQTAAYTVEIWKRFRKWGGIPTGITQKVENIFENSDFVYMLNQAGGDRQILAKQLGISTHQLSYVTHSGEGERAGQCGRGKRPQVREEAVETGAYLVREGYRSHKLKPYRKAAQAERQLEKANVNVLYQKSILSFPAILFSRWQQKQAIKKQYAAAKHAGQTAGNTAQAASKTGKAARTVKEKVQQAGAFVMRHKKGFLMAGVLFLITCMLMNTMSSCSMMAQSIGSVLSGTTYPSDDPEMLAVEADYAAREVQLQEEIDNIEKQPPRVYDEYRYDLGMAKRPGRAGACVYSTVSADAY